MNPCDEFLRTLVSGESLSDAQRVHRDGCPRCQSSSRLVTELSGPRAVAATRAPPGIAEIRRRSRRKTAVRVGLAGAALLLLAALRLYPQEKMRPEADILAALAETEEVLEAPGSTELPPGTEVLGLWDPPVAESDPFLDEWSL